MNVITGADLGRQAWVGEGGAPARERPEAGRFLPIVPSPRPCSKPRHADRKGGGLWTSTFHEQHGSGWIQWCLDEDFHCVRQNPTWHTWLLDPEPTARIYEIDSYADLQALVEAYPQTEHHEDRGYGSGSESRPAWHLIAKEFDGVRLTDEGQWATRLSNPLDLYGWDCESTLWLRWAFAAVEDGGMRTYEPRPDSWYDDDADIANQHESEPSA
jgi:hypothetical protein